MTPYITSYHFHVTLGIVLQQTHDTTWEYTLRANSSDVPWTGENIDKYDATFSLQRW